MEIEHFLVNWNEELLRIKSDQWSLVLFISYYRGVEGREGGCQSYFPSRRYLRIQVPWIIDLRPNTLPSDWSENPIPMQWSKSHFPLVNNIGTSHAFYHFMTLCHWAKCFNKKFNICIPSFHIQINVFHIHIFHEVYDRIWFWRIWINRIVSHVYKNWYDF